MKKIFTKNLFMLFAFTLCGGLMLNAQNLNTVIIDSPAGIAGSYSVGPAAFGGTPANPIVFPGIFADNSVVTMPCLPQDIGNVSGRIAFMDRGECQFSDKALNAEVSGAVAVIICNQQGNADGSGPDDIIGLPAGDNADMVSIPVYSMSFNDCNTLRVALENPVDMEITFVCAPPNYASNVVWGRNPGEGDFGNGLGDWTVNNSENSCDSTWYYDINSTAVGSFTNFTIGSGTACNGAMVFCSDFLDNGGLGAQFIGSGAGGCVAPTGIGYLESPLVDLTAIEVPAGNALFLEFDMAYRQFGSTYNVEFSTNGVTWSGACNPAPAATTNGPNVNETVRIPIPTTLANANNLAFRFGMDGNYYYWIIDDVRLAFYPSGSDVTWNNAFYSVPPQFRTPVSQGMEYPFTIDLVNTGDLRATDISLGVEIFNPAGAEVFNNSFSDDSLSLDNCDTDSGQNNFFPFVYEDTGLVEGRYDGNYTIDVPNDADTGNNTVPFYFEVSPQTYQSVPSQADIDNANSDTDPTNDLLNLQTITSGSIFSPTGNSFAPIYSVGNAFTVFSTTDADGDVLSIENITFGVAEADASGTAQILLYRLPNGDANLDGSIQPDEREVVGSNSAIINAGIFPDLTNITIPLWRAEGNTQFNEQFVELEAGMDYMLTFILQPLDLTTQINMLSYDSSLPIAGLRNFDHSATRFTGTGINGNTAPIGTYFEPLIDGTDADVEATTIDGWGINQLWTEVRLEKLNLLTSSTTELNNDIDVKVYPNPVTNFMNLALSLEENSDIQVEVYDVTGKKVIAKNYENIRQQTLNLNTEALTSGIYSVKIITAEGFTTKSVVVEN